MKLPQALRALASRNFRLFFAGQTVSLIGTWMQQLALAWVVYELTKSSWWLGLAGFAAQAPTFFLGPIAGVLVDRWNRHRAIIVTQTLAMLQAFLIAWLTLTDRVNLENLLAVSLLLGVINAFDMPARQAFLVEMIDDPTHLANAIALNSSMVNGARLAGPALAGLLLVTAGPGVCFLVNALSYVAVVAALLAMRINPRRRPHPPASVLIELRIGLGYAFGFPPIRAILLLIALVSLLGLSYAVLLPALNDDLLKGKEATFAMLSASSGVGALVAAVQLTRRSTVLGLGKWVAISPGLFGVALWIFSVSRLLWLSCLALIVAGFAIMTLLAASNTIVQTIVEEDKRGRVMSLFTTAFMGIAPLGSLLAGWIADEIGPPHMVQLGGACCIAGSIAFAVYLPRIRALVRPIYVSKGILPEIAVGLQTAAELTRPPLEK